MLRLAGFVLSIDEPGAATIAAWPKFEKLARPPSWLRATTGITPAQFAGYAPETSMSSFPADTTTIAPWPRAAVIAACIVVPQLPRPPRERLMILAGRLF